MERGASISQEVLASYVADAAREVDGVAGLAERPLHRGKAVTVSGDEDTLAVEVVLQLAWGSSAREVGDEVQRRVSEYLKRMAGLSLASIDVVVAGVGPPPAKR
jgi:uncharacterized alkaline shock family protein YloU